MSITRVCKKNLRLPGTRFASSKPTLLTRPSTAYTAVTHPEPAPDADPTADETLARAAAYLLPVYARPPIVLARGRGAHVWDTRGRRYLDFSAGVAVNALGHADPLLAERMAEQAGTLLHASNVYHNEWAGRLAELLVSLTQREGGLGWPAGTLPPPSPGAKVFFANSGTEANEGALKIARKVGQERWARVHGAAPAGGCAKHRIVSFENAFHGRSMGSLSVTPNAAYQAPFGPLLPGVAVGKLNDTAGLAELVTEETCGVIVEPVQGEGGVHVADAGWLRALRARCEAVGAVLIYDEIQCGLYRTGTLWAHSALAADCHPDVVTTAKPLANGYPIGAVLMRDSVAGPMTAGTHGTTFGGSALACALGHHVLTRLSDRAFVAQIAETSAHLLGRLAQLPAWFPGLVGPAVRGRGLMLAIACGDGAVAKEIVRMSRERGVLLLSAGKDAVRLVPSLNISREEVDEAVDVIESSLCLLAKQ